MVKARPARSRKSGGGSDRIETFTMARLSRPVRRWLSVALVAAAVFAAYLINVEIQSALGRRALAATGLVSLPLPEALARAG